MPVKNSVYKNESKNEYDLTEAQRNVYREISRESREKKVQAEKGLLDIIHEINIPKYFPNKLMPQLDNNGLKALSLFSGGGGLDFGFDKAGYVHIASYELIPICRDTFKLNRPNWITYCGPDEGDVTKVNWNKYINQIDIIHGGPPCQPFSIAGQQQGINDKRNMWGEFARAVNTIKPRAFVAENVPGLLGPKFKDFIKKYILDALSDYKIYIFEIKAADFGVPQIRNRVFFVGFKYNENFKKFKIPEAITSCSHLLTNYNKINMDSLFELNLEKTIGVREALGLQDIGFDSLAPTLRSGFTGKRNTTSILNSAAGQKSWQDLEIWPNGVQANRKKASSFPAQNRSFRLSVQDCALLQGFPEEWRFSGAVYQVLGQIGNSVAPPVAYHVAKSVSQALKY